MFNQKLISSKIGKKKNISKIDSIANINIVDMF